MVLWTQNQDKGMKVAEDEILFYFIFWRVGILDRVIKEGFAEEAAFEQRLA